MQHCLSITYRLMFQNETLVGIERVRMRKEYDPCGVMFPKWIEFNEYIHGLDSGSYFDGYGFRDPYYDTLYTVIYSNGSLYLRGIYSYLIDMVITPNA